MPESINLISTPKVEKKERSLFFSISLLFLLISIILGVGLLIFTLYLKSRLSALDVEKSKAISQMSSYNSQRIKYLTLKERLEAISPILSLNNKFNNAFTILEDNIPPQVLLSDIKIGKNTASIILTSSDLLSLNTFLTDNLKQISQKSSLVKAITINSFIIDKSTGGYNLGITLVYRESLLGQ